MRPAASASPSAFDSRDTTKGPKRSTLRCSRIVEIDADERIVAVVAFDLDDIDAAFAELDARYLAGEAAAHARTWSVIAGTMPRSIGTNFPRQRQTGSSSTTGVAAFAPGELPAYIRPHGTSRTDLSIHIEAVHRLNDFGAVITHVAHGTSHEGFDAEWRGIDL